MTDIFMYRLFKSLKRIAYLIIVALMLGMSNALIDETRMVNNTNAEIEQEITPDPDKQEPN
jgi:hypothetical protein